jgi:hypothetical protein
MEPVRTFVLGSFVLVSLASPREKFWGALLDITAAGVSLRGVDLNSYDEIAHQLRSGETASPATLFFPMHRVERVELDAGTGDLPCLADRFRTLSGEEASTFLGVAP